MVFQKKERKFVVKIWFSKNKTTNRFLKVWFSKKISNFIVKILFFPKNITFIVKNIVFPKNQQIHYTNHGFPKKTQIHGKNKVFQQTTAWQTMFFFKKKRKLFVKFIVSPKNSKIIVKLGLPEKRQIRCKKCGFPQNIANSL